MDPCASDTRDFVSSWKRDPTAREDELVAAQVQLRSVTRVAKWRDARASRRHAIEADGSDGDGGDGAGIVDDDAREDGGGNASPGGFSDAEERVVREHRHRLAASPLAHVRPLSASHVRPHAHGDGGVFVRARPQSAKASRRASGITSPEGKPHDFAWMPQAVKQSKWTEMLQHGPRFQEHNLQRLEAETYALLQRVLCGPETKMRLRCHGVDGDDSNRKYIATKKKTKTSTEKKVKAGSTSPAVGSGLQVARSNKKSSTRPSTSKETASTRRRDDSKAVKTKPRLGSARDSPPIDRRAVIEKTKARSKLAARPKKKTDTPTELSEKERKKRLAEAEASAKVMREMGWLDDLTLSDQRDESEADMPHTKSGSTKKKKMKKKDVVASVIVNENDRLTSESGVSSRPLDQDRSICSPCDEFMNGASVPFQNPRPAEQENCALEHCCEAVRAIPIILPSARSVEKHEVSSLHAPEISSTAREIDREDRSPHHGYEAIHLSAKFGDESDPVYLVRELGSTRVSNLITEDEAQCLHENAFTPQETCAPEVVDDGVQAISEEADLDEPLHHHTAPDTCTPHQNASSDTQFGDPPDTFGVIQMWPPREAPRESVYFEREDAWTLTNTDNISRSESTTPSGDLSSVQDRGETQDELAVGTCQPAGVLAADLLSKSLEPGPVALEDKILTEFPVAEEEQESSVPEPVLIHAINDHCKAPPVDEDSQEPVIADEYAEEFFEEEAIIDGTHAEDTLDDRQKEARDHNVPFVPCNDDNVDGERFVVEVEGDVPTLTGHWKDNFSALEVLPASDAEAPSIDHRGLGHEISGQDEDGYRSVVTMRAAESIQRQYRAFCNRRIIVDQVKFLSRKARRAKRKKSRDVGAAHHASVDMFDVTSELYTFAGEDSRVPTVSSQTKSDESHATRERVDVVVHTIDANCNESTKLTAEGDVIDNIQLDAVGSLHDLSDCRSPVGEYLTVVDMSARADETAVHLTLHQDDRSNENDSSDNAVLLEEDDAEVKDIQKSVAEPSIARAIVDTSEDEDVLGVPKQSTPREHSKAFISCGTGNDEGIIHQLVCAPAVNEISAVPETSATSALQELAYAIETTCHGEEENARAHSSTDCAGACDTDQLRALQESEEGLLLEEWRDQASHGDCAAWISPRIAPSIDDDSDVRGMSYDRAESEPENISPRPRYPPTVCDVCEPVPDGLQLLPSPCDQPTCPADVPPSIEMPALATFEEPNEEEFVSLDPGATDRDDPDFSLEVTTNMEAKSGEEFSGREIPATRIGIMDPTNDDSDRHAITSSNWDAKPELQSICVDSRQQDARLVPSIEEKAAAEKTRLSSAAGHIQRIWKEYATRLANPPRVVCQDAAAPEPKGTGDDCDSKLHSSTLHEFAPSASQVDISFPQDAADPNLSSILQDEEDREVKAWAVEVCNTPPSELAAFARSIDIQKSGCEDGEIGTKAPYEPGVENSVCDNSPVRGADFEHFQVDEEIESGDGKPIKSGVEGKSTPADDTDKTGPSSSRQHHAALCICRQYRRHVYRRNLLDQLAFFVRHHRRESRKKTRRLSGGLVHRVSADLPTHGDNSDDPSQRHQLAQSVHGTSTDDDEPPCPAVDMPDEIVSSVLVSTTQATQIAASHDDVLASSEPIVTELVSDRGNEDEDTVGSSIEPSTTSSVTKSSPTWERYIDSGANKSFYYNAQNQLSRWDRPSDSDIVDRTLGYAGSTQASDVGGSDTVNIEGNTSANSDLQDRWERYKDSETNKTFYFHPASQVSQWDRPNDACVIDTNVQATPSLYEQQSERWRLAKENNATVLESFGGWERCLCADSAEVFYYQAERIEFADGSAPPDEFTAAKAQLLADDTESGRDSDNSDTRWTLRRNRSLRGDRRGEWQAFVDTATHQTFYYNTVSGESTWDKPAAFMETTASGTAPASYEWVMYVDEATAQPYYVNLATNATSWERPVDFDEAVSAQDLSRLQGIGEHHEDVAMAVVPGEDVAGAATADGDEQDEYVISIQDDQDAAEWLAL